MQLYEVSRLLNRYSKTKSRFIITRYGKRVIKLVSRAAAAAAVAIMNSDRSKVQSCRDIHSRQFRNSGVSRQLISI